jgi:hypothetical protein
VERQLDAARAETVELCSGNEELSGRLAEEARKRGESASWVRGAAAVMKVNIDHYVTLQEVVAPAIELVQPAGSDFHERAYRLLEWVKEAAVNGVRHGAVAALGAAQLHLDPPVNMRWSPDSRR